MHVTELLQLTHWINENIVQQSVVNLYRQFQGKLQHNATQASKQPFEDQRNKLQETLSGITFEELSLEQIRFLTEIGIAENVGPDAATKVEALLVDLRFDMPTAVEQVKEMADSIERGIQKSNSIQEGLTGVEVPHPLEENEVLLRVEFQERASIDNLTDLKYWSKEWYDIGYGIARACRVAPESVRVVGAKRGSIILELAANPEVAIVLSGTLKLVTSAAKDLLNLRIMYEQARSLSINNDALEALKKDIENKEVEHVEHITEQAVKAIAGKTDPEERGFLKSSVSKLVVFYKRGGNVDYSPPQISKAEEAALEGEAKEDEYKAQLLQLRKEVAEIRKLRDEIRQLPHYEWPEDSPEKKGKTGKAKGAGAAEGASEEDGESDAE